MPADPSTNPAGTAARTRTQNPLNVFMNRYGTPLTTGFFVISAVTGIALFFHWGPGSFHPMHEWLSMVLLVPFILHMVRNWNGLVGYARRGTLYVPLLLSVLAAAYFVFAPASPQVGNRQVAFRLASLATKAPISQLAPVLGMDVPELTHRLRAEHFTVEGENQSLDEISQANSRTTNEALAAIMQMHGGRQGRGQSARQADGQANGQAGDHAGDQGGSHADDQSGDPMNGEHRGDHHRDDRPAEN
ncbi:DUF4405 domain-containing protein [Acetobacter sp. TBRC 12305]|uniref:DUF4405 domain-containing protein n=1 Tax=Acetobacter garciniae TaxID=2817435 RepID=A0A939HIX6_9PROT|nr:DUF4405 domain-containing protein [Acetobacter garciniae]MBO1324287.1 DUF4405 domain-containing protein [Acetobacter garciniae]MBX0343976.1 DUF4405 domain-containing protein [Acetobacter garciniae]